MVTQQQFIDFLSEIEPSPSTVASCSSAHSTLRRALREDENFGEVHIETFLSGSYKRDTAIRPQKIDGVLQRADVDIIVETTHRSTDAPKTVLALLHKALVDSGYESLKVNRRSIAVTLVSTDMDVVPVIANGDAYLIPDRELKEWLPTNPAGHTSWTVQVNKATNGNFKPLVKLFKWWRRIHLSTMQRPKGFILECLVAKHMSVAENNYETLFVELLESISNEYGWYVAAETIPFVEDPSVPGNDVFSNVTSEEFKKFYNKVYQHAKLARKALDESDDDVNLSLWRDIFGVRFPAKGSKSIMKGLLQPAVTAGLTFPSAPAMPNKPSGFA